MVASITVEAAQELGLSEGSDVVVVVKASDVMLATADYAKPQRVARSL